MSAREWLIKKGGYFYRPNKSGYTTSKLEAGRYTKKDAEREAAIEPWHMSAIHESDVPDPAMKLSAGYRILAPGELDAETLEQCVKELNKLPWFEDVVSLVDVEETLRSLAQGSKDKEARE